MFFAELAVREIDGTFHVWIESTSALDDGVLHLVLDVMKLPDLVTNLAWDGEKTRSGGSHDCAEKYPGFDQG